MEHYEKGSVVEVDEPGCYNYHSTVIHMKVAPGSKIKNLMGFAMKRFKEPDRVQITWNGAGTGTTKAITCAEIMKRKIKGLHQITKARYKRIEEYWEPKLEGLDRLKVNRNIPAITIILSKDPLDTGELGYQAPGLDNAFWLKPRQDNSAAAPSGERFDHKHGKKISSAKNKKTKQIKAKSGGDRERNSVQHPPQKPHNQKKVHDNSNTDQHHQIRPDGHGYEKKEHYQQNQISNQGQRYQKKKHTQHPQQTSENAGLSGNGQMERQAEDIVKSPTNTHNS